MRIVKLLVGRTPQSVADLVDAAGVTRTAVTEQLRELELSGLVERTVERLSGRGRPRHRYRATHAALVLLAAGKENVIGRALWQAIEETGGAEFVERIVDRLSRVLAEDYCRRITAKTPAGRLRQMNRLFTEEGLLVELAEAGGAVALAKRTCSFIGMFDESRRVCDIDNRVMQLVVGHPVRRVACRHDGDPSCVFELDKKSR